MKIRNALGKFLFEDVQPELGRPLFPKAQDLIEQTQPLPADINMAFLSLRTSLFAATATGTSFKRPSKKIQGILEYAITKTFPENVEGAPAVIERMRGVIRELPPNVSFGPERGRRGRPRGLRNVQGLALDALIEAGMPAPSIKALDRKPELAKGILHYMNLKAAAREILNKPSEADLVSRIVATPQLRETVMFYEVMSKEQIDMGAVDAIVEQRPAALRLAITNLIRSQRTPK